MLPPILTALSSTAIEVAIRPPLNPNGEIISYSLTRYTSTTPRMTFIPLNVSSLPIVNESFIYEDVDLSPFTNYTYTLTVCTSAADGCTSSGTVSQVTDEANPNGLGTPIVGSINESSLSVSWESPSQPNGIILSYVILQRSFGFEVVADLDMIPNCCEDYLNANKTLVGSSCRRVVQINETTLTFTVTNLQAYSNYRYCIIAANSAGATLSPSSNISQTHAAAMPTAGPNLTASTVNSTAIYLSWTSLDVSQLLGPFGGYSLYRRIAGQEPPGGVIFLGSEQEFTATDLVASTEYTFLVGCIYCICCTWLLLSSTLGLSKQWAWFYIQ